MIIKHNGKEYEIMPSPKGIFSYSHTGEFSFPLFVGLAHIDGGNYDMISLDFIREATVITHFKNPVIVYEDFLYCELHLPVFINILKHQLKAYDITPENSLDIAQKCSEWIVKIMEEHSINVRQKVKDYINEQGYKELFFQWPFNQKLLIQ